LLRVYYSGTQRLDLRARTVRWSEPGHDQSLRVVPNHPGHKVNVGIRE
jgi:hypothetical protein